MNEPRPAASVPLVHGLVVGMIVAGTAVYTLFDSAHAFGPPAVLALLTYLCYLVYRGVRAIEYGASE